MVRVKTRSTPSNRARVAHRHLTSGMFGTSYATSNLNLPAPYKVATWSDIPSARKVPNGRRFDDYGGYVSIWLQHQGRDATGSTSFAQLTNPEYKNEVGIKWLPDRSVVVFSAVFAAALANGESLRRRCPTGSIQFFGLTLNKDGNYVPGGSAATAESGTTPILIWWDYLQDSIKQVLPTWTVNIPTDASYAAYYSQAIERDGAGIPRRLGSRRSTCIRPLARTSGCKVRPSRRVCGDGQGRHGQQDLARRIAARPVGHPRRTPPSRSWPRRRTPSPGPAVSDLG